MKAKELINILSKLDPNIEVHGTWIGSPILNIVNKPENDNVHGSLYVINYKTPHIQDHRLT